MANTLVRFLSGEEQNVDNEPISAGKVLFAVDPSAEGTYSGYIYYDFYDAAANDTVRICMSGTGGGGKVATTLKVADKYGHLGDSVVIANVSSATLKLPDIIEAKYYIAQDTFTDQFDLFNVGSRMYGNGFLIANEYAPNNLGWIRLIGESGTLNTTLELAMGDSLTAANNTNTIVARTYNRDGDIDRETVLLNGDGDAHFYQDVYARYFIGDLRGNADTATDALNDDAGRNIQNTYLAEIKENKSSSSEYSFQALTGSGLIKNIIKIPNASRSVAGLITAGAQVLTGAKTINNKGSLSIEGENAFIYSGIQENLFDKDAYIWFSHHDEDGTPVYKQNFTYNSETSTLKVTNITGDYEYLPNHFGTHITGIITNAEQDGSGNIITHNYVSKIKVSTGLAYNNNKGTNFSLGGFNGIGEEITTLRIPNASPTIAGIITNTAQTLSGDKTFNDNLIFADSGFLDKNIAPFGYDINGIRGYMASNDTWTIRGFGTNTNKGYLEIATGNDGVEPIYMAQYDGIPWTTESHAKNVVTVLDPNGGSVFNFITIDNDTREANPDFSLQVNGESSFLHPIFTEESIRLSAADKASFYYITPSEVYFNQNTLNHAADYYAFLESLLLNEDLEVNGVSYFNGTLNVKDIFPFEHDVYNLGKGTPEDSEELYFHNSFIKNMYSNWNIIQGEVYDITPITHTTENPRLTFQENVEGMINNPIHLVYMNHFMDDNYDTLNGLRLVGKEERPWFEVDGSIYSRYDLDKYVQTFANQDSVGQFLTTTGLSEELSYALTEVSDEGILQFLQYNAENNSIKTTVGQKGNIVDSKYTFGLYESHLLTTVTGGTSELLLTGTDGVSISIKSDFAPENTICIKTAENISNSFLSNLEYGFNIVALYNESKIEAYNDNEHGYYLKGNYKNNAIIESSIEEQQFSFSGIINNDAYLKQLVNIEETSLKLKSTAGYWSYIELHDSQKHWNIGVTTAIEGATANLQPSSLQFRKDNSDTKKITFNYDDNIGINLYGKMPYIDFRYDSSDVAFRSSIQAITPLLDAYGLLEMKGQYVFSDVIAADTTISNGGTIIIGHPRENHLEIDNYQILAKTNGTTGGKLSLNTGGGRVFIGKGGLDINGSNDAYMLYVNGNTSLNGPTDVLGEFTAHVKSYFLDTVNVKADILPQVSNTYSLGSETLKWKNVYASTFHGDLDGTAKNAIYDDAGNQISTKYVTLDTDQTILAKKQWQVEQVFLASNGFRLAYGSYGVIFKNDGTDFKIKLTDAGASTTTGDNYNTLEPFRIDLTTGYSYAYRLHGAVWNDYAEYRIPDKQQEIKPGNCVCENGDGSLSLSKERLQAGGNIVSDTFGFAIGETKDAKMPLAVSGRVLAYTYEDRNIFKAGDAVCAAPNGTVSLMTREEIINWPDRIIGIVSEIPQYKYWGEEQIQVNERIWIKLK